MDRRLHVRFAGRGFIAAPIAGHLSDKVGRRQIIMSSMSMTGVIILAMTFAGGTKWFVLLVAVLGFFLFAVRAVLQAWLLDATPPGMGGSAVGILFGMQALGMAIGPVSGRHHRRSLRHHVRILFPRRHHHRRQSC